MSLFAVEKWRPWLVRVETELGDGDPFPIDRALTWIRLESGGNVCSVGRVEGGHVYEAGLAQTYFETPSSRVFGVTSAELRAKCSGTTMPTNLVDADRLLQARVALLDMKAHRARARAKMKLAGCSLSEDTLDFWCFVKLTHALPGLYSYLAPCKRALGRPPSWREFRRYVEGLSAESLAAIDRGTARYAGAFDRVFRNCEAFAGGVSGFVELELLIALAVLAVAASRFIA